MYEPTLQLELFRDSSDRKWSRSSCSSRCEKRNRSDQIRDLEPATNGEPNLPYYLMLSKLLNRGRDRIKHDPDRITQVNLKIEGQGCSVLSQCALLGRYDFTTIEAPDNAHMSRLAVDLGARGTIETETLSAEPTELFIEAMKGQ